MLIPWNYGESNHAENKKQRELNKQLKKHRETCAKNRSKRKRK